MEFLQKPPQALLDALPQSARTFLESGGWSLLLGGAALLAVVVIAFIAWRIIKALSGGPKSFDTADRTEDLSAIPPPAPSTGDRRLVVEGVPVRIRLVVLSPSGRSRQVSMADAGDILDKVVTGLGEIAAHDRPVIRLWPSHLSPEGFANAFHRDTPLPEGEGKPSRWVMLAGRAHLGDAPIFLGLGLQAIKPTTLGRRNLDMHEWATTLRIRTKD